MPLRVVGASASTVSVTVASLLNVIFIVVSSSMTSEAVAVYTTELPIPKVAVDSGTTLKLKIVGATVSESIPIILIVTLCSDKSVATNV